MQQRTVKFFVTLLRGYIYCFNLMQGWEGREGRSGDTLVIIGRERENDNRCMF